MHTQPRRRPLPFGVATIALTLARCEERYESVIDAIYRNFLVVRR